MGESVISVVTQEPIACGTLIGPLPLSPGSMDPLALLTWRCVDNLPPSRQILKVNLRDQAKNPSRPNSWMVHVNPARDGEEQNLELVPKSGQLYYRAVREIVANEELLSWFGKDLADILRLPVVPSTNVDGTKRFFCVLCNELFHHSFPVISHLMYRCPKRGMVSAPTSAVYPERVKQRKNGGRVTRFDIASLTDTHEEKSDFRQKEEEANLRVQPPTVTSPCNPLRSETDESRTDSRRESTKRPSEEDEGDTQKRSKSNSLDARLSPLCSPKPASSKPVHATHVVQSSAFKVTSGEVNGKVSPPVGRESNNSGDRNGASAFKKVDKMATSSASTPSLHFTPVSTLIPSSLASRDVLFPSSVAAFSPFSYPMTPVTSSPPGGASLGNTNLISTVPRPMLHSPGDLSSAFAPTGKVTNGSSHVGPVKLAEEIKLHRAGPVPDRFETRTIMSAPMNGTRMPGMNLQYGKAFPTPLDSFSSKSFPSPLLPFLPPSLAALSFPAQNWCAKCNASFRMTSDLVYHMRSHHKRETDIMKQKREEKLKCPICNESFRERHHLTRHMTSHQ